MHITICFQTEYLKQMHGYVYAKLQQDDSKIKLTQVETK